MEAQSSDTTARTSIESSPARAKLIGDSDDAAEMQKLLAVAFVQLPGAVTTVRDDNNDAKTRL